MAEPEDIEERIARLEWAVSWQKIGLWCLAVVVAIMATPLEARRFFGIFSPMLVVGAGLLALAVAVMWRVTGTARRR